MIFRKFLTRKHRIAAENKQKDKSKWMYEDKQKICQL